MKRKAVSCLLVLAALITMTPTIPTMAAENPDNTIQEATTTGTQGATVIYEQDSAFTVTIPKTITLGQNKSATYGVKVKGDIAGNETVTVTPDATVQLTDSNGKAAVTGTITQDITEFAATEVNQTEGSSTTGNIVANDLTSGDWSGNFEFAIGVNKELIAGLYDADGRMVCTWEESGIDVSKSHEHSIYKTDPAFAYSVLQAKSEVRSIVIPDNITSIGDNAFYYCSPLISITIPNSVTNIGNNAFDCCFNLKAITIPEGVTSIGDHTFNDCRNLTSITIPDSVTSIGEWAFSKSGLTSITIPDSVTSIGDVAFYECYDLTSITIPNSVTSIGDSAFSGCSGLTSITIPNSVTSIGESTFSGCRGLTSITIPNSVTSIGKWAFSRSGLTSITIPDSVTSIGDGAFQYCSSLKSVTYKGTVYTHKAELEKALSDNKVSVGTNAFIFF